jgi:hypothetical protein
MSVHTEPFDHSAIEIPGVTGPRDPVEYDRWFRAKVQESLDDPRPPIPHAEVMATMEAIVERAEARKRVG